MTNVRNVKPSPRSIQSTKLKGDAMYSCSKPGCLYQLSDQSPKPPASSRVCSFHCFIVLTSFVGSENCTVCKITEFTIFYMYLRVKNVSNGRSRWFQALVEGSAALMSMEIRRFHLHRMDLSKEV